MSATTPTKLVVLGTDHSAQLVAESYQPAVFRAFFDRAHPDAMCIERPPEEYLRDGYYAEYGYEARYLAPRWARERGIAIYPIDWVLPADDQWLVWGVPDVDGPPFLRTAGYVRSLMHFGEEAHHLDLFFAEAKGPRQRVAAWYDQPRQPGERDFPRRLGLYRTFLQAMRIKTVARKHPGGTVLVMIGYFHKGDVEGVLGGTPSLEIVQPSTFGYPAPDEVEAAIRREDLFAILSFNLLGVQSKQGLVDWDWLHRSFSRLEGAGLTAELLLLRTRMAVLHSGLPPREAIEQYGQARVMAGAGEHFTFDGVVDRRRIDSYYDPFGNLTIHERALLEQAREYHKLGRADAVRERLRELRGVARASDIQGRQLEAYWEEFVSRTS